MIDFKIFASNLFMLQFSMPAMSREKSVVDVNVTEDQKQAMCDQLLQQERYKHDQITAAQARQEMMVSVLAARGIVYMRNISVLDEIFFLRILTN